MSAGLDNNLRCNWLSCRKELLFEALVTTCSHVYCVECATRERILGVPPSERSVCPACEQSLKAEDTTLLQTLNCNEEKKTLVLSGLHPSVIMECAGRAMSFWEYQSAQEIKYHKHINKSYQKHHEAERREVEAIIANAQITLKDLESQIADLQSQKAELIHKNENLERARVDLKKRFTSQQQHYQHTKRTAVLSNMEKAVAKSQSAIARPFSSQISISSRHDHRMQQPSLDFHYSHPNMNAISQHHEVASSRGIPGFSFPSSSNLHGWNTSGPRPQLIEDGHPQYPHGQSLRGTITPSYVVGPLSHKPSAVGPRHRSETDVNTTGISPGHGKAILRRSSVTRTPGSSYGRVPRPSMGLSSGLKMGQHAPGRFP